MVYNQQPDEEMIRITRTEVLGEHVDDLLMRKSSLEGGSGLTRQHKRRWYYQNWFIFMLAAMIAAIAAWAFIEPKFNDLLYIQGTITDADPSALMPERFTFGSQYLELKVPGRGWIEVDGQTVWLLDRTRYYPKQDDRGEIVNPNDLSVGQEVGLHVDYSEIGWDSLTLAMFVNPNPDPRPGGSTQSLSELSSETAISSVLLFPLVAGLIGLALGAVDGVICRLIRRAIIGGLVGALIGVVGGFVFSLLAGLIYAPINSVALKQSDVVAGEFTALGFILQMAGRALAWGMVGIAAGLGQGIALRSKRLFLYGLLGGALGGLIGGLLFDPLDILILGMHKPSAHWSRLVGLTVIGGTVGVMIGIIELLARDAWLQMTQGPLAGKEFLIFRDLMVLGSSPRSEIYLFNDPLVAPVHAKIRAVGDDCEIEAQDSAYPVLINKRPVNRSRLRHGDEIALGQTIFIFQRRKG